MEVRNVLAVVIGLFAILVLVSLFGGRSLLTGKAVATFSSETVSKGDALSVTISNNLYGVSKDASVISGGSSCSGASESALDLVLCDVERCMGNVQTTFKTVNLGTGKSYKLRYKEFTSPTNEGEEGTVAGGLSAKWKCSTDKFTVE